MVGAPVAGLFSGGGLLVLFLRYGTGGGQLQPVGQRTAVPGADGPLCVAVVRDGQDDCYAAVPVRRNGDLPQVAASVHPLGLPHPAARHLQGVVTQGPVAHRHRLAEGDAQGEGVLAVMGLRRVQELRCQRRPVVVHHRDRRREGRPDV